MGMISTHMIVRRVKREIKVKEPAANKAITVTMATNRGYSLPSIYIPYWMPRCQKCPLIIIWFFHWWYRHCEKGTGIPFSCLLRQDQPAGGCFQRLKTEWNRTRTGCSLRPCRQKGKETGHAESEHEFYGLLVPGSGDFWPTCLSITVLFTLWPWEGLLSLLSNLPYKAVVGTTCGRPSLFPKLQPLPHQQPPFW